MLWLWLVPVLFVIGVIVALTVTGYFVRRKVAVREDQVAFTQRRSAQAGSYGRELFGRSLRIDNALENVAQARTICAGSLVEAEVESICLQIENDALRQEEALRKLAPLDGAAREIALGRLDPAIDELERAGASLQDLTARVADEVRPAHSDGARVQQRADAIRAAIDDLDALTDIGYDIDDLVPELPNAQPDAAREIEPPEPAS